MPPLRALALALTLALVVLRAGGMSGPIAAAMCPLAPHAWPLHALAPLCSAPMLASPCAPLAPATTRAADDAPGVAAPGMQAARRDRCIAVV